MMFVLPTQAKFSFQDRGKGRCDFVYWGAFKSEKVVARTASMICAAQAAGALPAGVRFRHVGKRLVLGGKGVRRVDVGNMMVGEFLMWSSIADTTLRDFIGAAVTTGRATVGKPPR